MTDTPGKSEFERLLAAPYEQFDKRSELLASIEAYSKAVPATAGGVVEVPKYTESDMQVLTEAALRLGRKEALEEIADELVMQSRKHPEPIGGRWHCVACRLLGELAVDVREIASQPSLDATSGRTDPDSLEDK